MHSMGYSINHGNLYIPPPKCRKLRHTIQGMWVPRAPLEADNLHVNWPRGKCWHWHLVSTMCPMVAIQWRPNCWPTRGGQAKHRKWKLCHPPRRGDTAENGQQMPLRCQKSLSANSAVCGLCPIGFVRSVVCGEAGCQKNNKTAASRTNIPCQRCQVARQKGLSSLAKGPRGITPHTVGQWRWCFCGFGFSQLNHCFKQNR